MPVQTSNGWTTKLIRKDFGVFFCPDGVQKSARFCPDSDSSENIKITYYRLVDCSHPTWLGGDTTKVCWYNRSTGRIGITVQNEPFLLFALYSLQFWTFNGGENACYIPHNKQQLLIISDELGTRGRAGLRRQGPCLQCLLVLRASYFNMVYALLADDPLSLYILRFEQ